MKVLSDVPAGVLKDTNLDSVQESARHDVDKDFFLMFNVVDENTSWYLDENISDLNVLNLDDPEFKKSNLMHGES